MTNFISGCDSVSDVLLDPYCSTLWHQLQVFLLQKTTRGLSLTKLFCCYLLIFFFFSYFIDSVGGIVQWITFVITAGTTSTQHNKLDNITVLAFKVIVKKKCITSFFCRKQNKVLSGNKLFLRKIKLNRDWGYQASNKEQKAPS